MTQQRANARSGESGNSGDSLNEQQASDRLAQALVGFSAVQLELDRERLERAEIEALFDEILEAMADAIVVTDPTGRVRRQNRAAVHVLGPDPTSITGQTISSQTISGQTISGDAAQPIVETAWAILRESPTGSHVREVTVENASGETIPLSVSSNVIRDPHGKVIGAVSAARDLSETQRLLVVVREAEARWKLLVGVSDVLASSLDVNEAVKRVCEMLSLSLSVMTRIVLTRPGGIIDMDTSIDGAFCVGAALPPRTAIWAVVHDQRLINISRTDGYPIGVNLPDGSAVLAPLRNGSESYGVLVLSRPDIDGFSDKTELVQEIAGRIGMAVANARLRESLGHAERLREKTEFRQHIAAALSHDMKTPLASIVGAVQALQHGSMEKKRAEQLHQLLHRQAQRLDRLVSQLLDFARLEAGHPLTLRLQPNSVESVRDVIESVVVGHPGRRFEVVVDPHAPSVSCDLDRVGQIVANLVSNAVKYAPQALPIGLAVQATADRRGMVIEVTDHGPGIEPSDQARLFEQFRRGTNVGSTEGAGLGLYLAKAMVDAHGGSIRCESRVGRGTTFTVTLPVGPG